MKTRLICLAFALLMLASTVLTGCSTKTNEEVESEISETASESARSLTMWLVSEKEVDEATASRITAAVNTITESKFKARMRLYFLTDDEYRAVLSETIRAKEDSKSNFISNGNKEEETTPVTNEDGTIVEETVTDKYGRVTIKYPDLQPNQVDLIYIAGEDMFREYVANGWLKQLDEELSASSKKIKEYVSQTLLTAAKIEGGTFAVPNNRVIGEYTYMLLDKELMQGTNFNGVYEQGKINGFFNSYVYSYLENIRAQAGSGIVPIGATYEEALNLLAHYWSISPSTYEVESERFSLLGYCYTDPKTLSRGNTILSFNSLFGDDVFRENYLELNKFRLDGGYFSKDTDAENTRYAVRFETGDLSKYNEYCKADSNYYPVIVKYPSVDVEDVFGHMFGVCTYTVDLSRSMEILTYLTTNADFRNLLQYGVEGTDYKKVTDEHGNVTVERLEENPSYLMDIFKTGNAFIAYPDPAQDLSADVWEIGKQQNRQALIEPLLNFDFAQLALASGSSSSSTPSTGSKGYAYTWTTGYSREILAQNDLLKAWMDAADQAGKGVYVLHTCPSGSGQNLNAMIYYYNNGITNATVEVTDGDGALNVSYSGTAGNGQEITVISFYGKKNASKLNWNYTFNGTTAAAVTKYQNSLLNFDFLNTNTYSVSLSQNLTKAMISGNAAVRNWVMDTAKTGTNAYLGTYVSENAETGKKLYTYLVYVPTIEAPYSVTVQPTGTAKNLQLSVQYQVNSDKKLGNTKYALFLVSVEADSDVAVNLSLTGLTATEAAFTADPAFAMCGNLNVELVKYFDALSKQVESIVDTAATKTATTEAEAKANEKALENIINDLGVLFTVRENAEFSDSALRAELEAKLVSDEVKALISAEGFDLAEFYFNLLSATSSAEVHHKEMKYDETTGEEKGLVDATTDSNVAESYYYYKTPYMLYYSWLKSNGLTK